MNKQQIEGKLQQFNGEVKKMWGRMTDDEITFLDGKDDKFYGQLKEKYGIAREEGEAHIKKMRDALI